MVKVQFLTTDFINMNRPMEGLRDKHHASRTQISHRQIRISLEETTRSDSALAKVTMEGKEGK
jgi:hypothetical protein